MDGGEKNRVRRELLEEFELREWKNGSKGQRNWVAFTGNEGHGESWLPTTIGPVFHLREVCTYFQRAACVIVTFVDRILLPPATNSGNGDTGTKRKSRLFAGFSAKKLNAVFQLHSLNAVSFFSLPGPFFFHPARMKNGKRFETIGFGDRPTVVSKQNPPSEITSLEDCYAAGEDCTSPLRGTKQRRWLGSADEKPHRSMDIQRFQPRRARERTLRIVSILRVNNVPRECVQRGGEKSQPILPRVPAVLRVRRCPESRSVSLVLPLVARARGCVAEQCRKAR